MVGATEKEERELEEGLQREKKAILSFTEPTTTSSSMTPSEGLKLKGPRPLKANPLKRLDPLRQASSSSSSTEKSAGKRRETSLSAAEKLILEEQEQKRRRIGRESTRAQMSWDLCILLYDFWTALYLTFVLLVEHDPALLITSSPFFFPNGLLVIVSNTIRVTLHYAWSSSASTEVIALTARLALRPCPQSLLVVQSVRRATMQCTC